MKIQKIITAALALSSLTALPALASQGNLVDSVAAGCKTELESYCKDVTPGQGRVLACLYARSDKLSGQCEFALYDAAVQLERAVAALSYMANECGKDLTTYCGGVVIGEGRVLDCLAKNKAKVSDRCKQAQKDLGFTK
jgi:hypothetical protein